MVQYGKKKHIDDVQPATVDEHLKLLVANAELIDDEISDTTSADLPEWYDEKLFRAGQRYFETNEAGITTAALFGLISVLAVPSILKGRRIFVAILLSNGISDRRTDASRDFMLQVLTFTKQSGTSCTAFKRYIETILHTRNLYLENPKDEGSYWYKSLNVIRWKHCRASRSALRSGIGGITHRDMAVTQFGFIGYALLKPKELGLTNTLEEREGLNHFWRVTGYLLGISDKFNICRKTEAETTALCGKLNNELFKKYLTDLCPSNFEEMTSALLDGLWYADVSMDKDVFLFLTYEMTDLPYKKPLGLYSKLNLAYRRTIVYLINTPYIGTYVRSFFNYYVRFNSWMVSRWPVLAWWKWGKTDSQIKLYPKLISE